MLLDLDLGTATANIYPFCSVAVRGYPRNLNRIAHRIFNRAIELQTLTSNAEIIVFRRHDRLVQVRTIAYFMWHHIAIQFSEEEWNIRAICQFRVFYCERPSIEFNQTQNRYNNNTTEKNRQKNKRKTKICQALELLWKTQQK